MQWAYSELFQNYYGAQVQSYLDYALAQSAQRGLYVHYSETHDNPRLAAQGAGRGPSSATASARLPASAAPSASPTVSNGSPPSA